jgi:8-oxo-dGTP pyrophosphatase MutT (NUDIX family)
MLEPVIVTLSFIRTESKLLLALKKRGFGAGKWNGYGGKIQENETLEESARREIREEAEIEVEDLEKRAEIEFFWPSGKNRPIHCHVYEILSYSGEPVETEEMKPAWYDIADLPYDVMWSDDPHWLPRFLAGESFTARFAMGDDDQVIEHEIAEIKNP